jgi:hypothetical protein
MMTITILLRLVLFTGLMLCAILVPSTALAANQQSGGPDLCKAAKSLQELSLTEVCGSISYLGFGTFTELGLLPSGSDILGAINSQAEGREELAAQRHFFAYDVFVFSVGKDRGARGWDFVLRAASAIKSLKSSRPNAYRFITSTLRYPTAPSMPTSLWKNRNERIFISFDKTPDFIAASTTLIGRSIQSKGVTMFSNYPIISIDEVTITGEMEQKGSRRIYKLPSAENNYRAYMTDGFLFSLVHEMVHQYITYLNSTNRLANTIYLSRNNRTTDAEEVIANETAMALLGGDLRPEMLQSVMDENTDLVLNSGVREWLSQWNALAGNSRSLLIIPD